MTRFLQALLGIGLLSIILLIFALQSGIINQDTRDMWENGERWGYGVFSTFMSQGGSPIEMADLGMSLSGGKGGLIANAVLGRDEEKRVLQQVQDGGTLLIIGDRFSGSSANLERQTRMKWKSKEQLTVNEVSFPDGGTWSFEGSPLVLGDALVRSPDMISLVTHEEEVYGAIYPYGEGSIYVLSTPELLQNHSFRHLPKAKFLARVLPLFEPRAWSAKIEYYSSEVRLDQPFRVFFLPEWIPFTLQIILAFLILVTISFVRFGKPRVPWNPNRKVLSHHLEAVGLFWSNRRGIAIANGIHQEIFLKKLEKIRPEMRNLSPGELLDELAIPLKNDRGFALNTPPQSKEVLSDYCQIRNTILKEFARKEKGA
jgi:hypothetical protein